MFHFIAALSPSVMTPLYALAVMYIAFADFHRRAHLWHHAHG